MTNDEIFDAYLDAFQSGDSNKVLRLVAPGATFWHNFDDKDRDLASSVGELGRLKEFLSDPRYEVLERFALKDGFGVRMVLRSALRATGEAFASHQAKFFRIRDGKITRIEEYVAPARGG